MMCRRFLALSPDNEPLLDRLYAHQIGETWVAMILRKRHTRAGFRGPLGIQCHESATIGGAP